MTIVQGVFLAVAANMLTGTSQVLQKKALLRINGNLLSTHARGKVASSEMTITDAAASSEAKPKTPRFQDLEWICGIVLSYLGDALNFLAYSKCNPAILSPLGFLSILTGLFLASTWLNERISRRKIRGYSIALIGVLLLILSAQIGSERQEWSGSLSSKSFFQTLWSFHIVGGFAIVISLQLLCVYLALKTWKRPRLSILVTICSLFAALSITLGRIVSIYFASTLYHYTKSSSFIGPLNTPELSSSSVFQHIIFIVIVAALLVSSTVLNEVFRQKCLDSFPVVLFYPLFYAGFNASVILTSTYFWSEFKDPAGMRNFWALFVAGILIVAFGMNSSVTMQSSPSPDLIPTIASLKEAPLG